MKLSKKSGGNFSAHDEGNFKGVCVDVTPLVKQQSKFGDREVFRIVFETDAPAREDGSRQCVWSRGFTASLNEKANLRKFLRQWRGRDLSAAEEAEFETEGLIGLAANLVIVHETSESGEVYANIVACTPDRSEAPLQPSGKFTRKKDREEKSGAAGESTTYRGAAKPADEAPAAEAVDSTQAGSDWTKVKVHVGKHSGVELRDLDAEAIEKLHANWLPKHETNAKATADDKRLAAALKIAKETLDKETAQVAEAAAEY